MGRSHLSLQLCRLDVSSTILATYNRVTIVTFKVHHASLAERVSLLEEIS
jgi:hypothetical protein